jgi:hypothetical protein
MSKIIICTIPKSGTYLMDEILSQAGSSKTNIHLKENGYTNYKVASIDEARKSPGRFNVSANLKKVLVGMSEGSHAVSHLSPSYKSLIENSGCRVGFLYRNLRDVIVSYSRWSQKTGRWGTSKYPWSKFNDHRLVLGFINDLGGDIETITGNFGWWDKDVPMINYESINGDYGEEIQFEKVLSFLRCLGLNVSEDDIKKILNKSLNKETITYSGSRTSWKDFWSMEVEHIFKDRGLYDINKKMGYE